MKYDPDKHHRRSIRLQGYDYSQGGAYFVTIVTHDRACLFGEVVDGEMRLNAAGQIVQWEWRRLGQRFPNVQLEAFVVMPNHIHGILIIHAEAVGATHPGQNRLPSGRDNAPTETAFGNGGSPLRDHEVGPPQEGAVRPTGPAPGSLGAIIGQFKSRVTKRLGAQPEWSGTPVWQRNYYERIIRTDDDHHRILLYIESNPVHWKTDDENPDKPR